MNISRASDGSVTDIYGDFFGNLRLSNGTSASSWIGGSQANVLIWYDQSGSGFNATQSTQTTTAGATGRAPQLVADPGGSGQLVIFFPNQNSSNTTSYYGFSMSAQSVASASFRFRISSGKISDSGWESLLCTSSDNQGVRLNGLNLSQGDGNDFLNPGGFATANGTYKTATPFATFLRDTWYNLIASRASGTLNMIHIGHCDANHFFGGLLSRSYYGYMTDIITYSTKLSPSDYNMINAPYTSPLTGTPLFSQLSASATSSAVGAFSLRAVNGTSVKAVQVRPVAEFPPTGFTSAATGASNSWSQNLTSPYSFGGSGTYVASSSTIAFSGLYYPRYAFDKSNTGDPNEWAGIGGSYPNTYTYAGSNVTTVSGVSYGGEWLQLQMPITLLPTSISITSPYNTGSANTFVFAGSTNGSTWTLLLNQTTSTALNTPNTTKSFTFSTDSYYNYFRLILTSAYSGFGQVGELVIFGSPFGSEKDFYADRLGNLLTAPVTGQTLANWLGGATGYVVTWYDQSGRGNHTTQATAANQPVIQRATKGPGYSALFNGTTNFFSSTTGGLLDNTNYTFIGITRRNAAKKNSYFFGINGPGALNSRLHVGYEYSFALGDSADSFKMDQYGNLIAYNPANFTTASAEALRYTTGMQSSTSGKKLYTSDTANYGITASSGNTNQLTSGGGFMYIGQVPGQGFYQGEIYELLVFTKSLYDLDGSASITQIYNNQLGAYGT
jgi:hypothetical protein